MDFLKIKSQRTDIVEFVNFWSRQYGDSNEALYEQNIGKSLSNESIKQLFAWKNGSKRFEDIAKKKRLSIEHNYINGPKTPPPEGKREVQKFLGKPGGAIWRIFWLHCLNPKKYPIFDQHVYRAMCYLEKTNVDELPHSDSKKIDIYLNEYLPFWSMVLSGDSTKFDRALWQFGKILKFFKKGIDVS